MTIEAWLSKSVKKLDSAYVPTARLDAEVLLTDILVKDRTWIHAHLEYTLQRSDLCKLDEQIERRLTHEPLAYIRGRQEFFGRDFVVSPVTLTPRPETENLVEMLLEIKPSKIIDIGTGSGCIAITIKLELPASSVVATDISDKCLEIARINAKNLNAKVSFFESDLLQDLHIADISGATLCGNLPYVPSNFSINTAASHEPKLAIFGGEDGLDYYRQLFEEIISLPVENRPVSLLTESLPLQHETIQSTAETAGYKLVDTRDFIQYFVKS